MGSAWSMTTAAGLTTAQFMWLVWIGLMVAAGVVYVWLAPGRSDRRRALEAWAARHGAAFNPGRSVAVASRLHALSALGPHGRPTASMILSGAWAGRPFHAFDLHVKPTRSAAGRGGLATRCLSVVVIEASAAMPGLVARPEGVADAVNDALGVGDLDFESAEFSARYHVRAEKPRWAYAALNPAAIERLLGMPPCTVETIDRFAAVVRDDVHDPADITAALELLTTMLDHAPRYAISPDDMMAS